MTNVTCLTRIQNDVRHALMLARIQLRFSLHDVYAPSFSLTNEINIVNLVLFRYVDCLIYTNRLGNDQNSKNFSDIKKIKILRVLCNQCSSFILIDGNRNIIGSIEIFSFSALHRSIDVLFFVVNTINIYSTRYARNIFHLLQHTIVTISIKLISFSCNDI
jgi:hypothetical protein